MTDPFILTAIIISLALIFDFTNGFHDASNSIATIVATQVLKPFQAVLWAAFFNFAAYFVFSSGVAKMVGSGLIDLSFVTPFVIMAGLVGAIFWNLLTWWLAIPSSSSHALMGGYAGSAIANAVYNGGWALLTKPLHVDGWLKVLLFIFVAPLVGYLISYVVLMITRRVLAKLGVSGSNPVLKGMQLLSSAMLSLNHGSNDAQKTAGIIAGALVVGGYISAEKFEIPSWVLFMSYFVIALGTLMGGWRIVQTLGFKLTRLRPVHGFAAETGAASSILLATLLHLPISTTLATSGSIIGVGAARGKHHVHWPLVNKLLFTWFSTIPASAALGAAGLIVYRLIAG